MVTQLRPTTRQTIRQPNRKSERREPPEAGWLLEESEHLKEFWQPQKKRMREDQKLYELERDEPEEGESNIVKNSPRVLVNKIARMLSSAEWRAVFDPDIDPEPSWLGPVSTRDDTATVKEKLVTWVWKEADWQWRDGLNSGLKATLLRQALVRGMMALRLKPAVVETEDDFPFEITPIDGINLYPRLAGRNIKHILHIYKTEWQEVVAEWDLDDVGHEPTDAVEVIAYYDDTYWALMIESAFIKEPEEHGLGFCPLIVGVAEGGEFRADAESSSNEWVKFVGVGLLEDVRQAIIDRNRVATLRDEMITRVINPPMVTWTKDGKPIIVDLRNGAVTNLDVDFKEEVRPLTPGAASTDLAKAEADFDSDVQSGSVPRILFGSMDSPISGYAASLTSKNARDILEPWIDLFVGIVERANIGILKMIANPELGLSSTLTVAGSSSKLGRFRERVSANQIGPDTSHTVEFGDVLPSDLPAILGMAIQAIGANLLSRRTILEKFLSSVTGDSKGEITRIIQENASLNAGQQIANQLGTTALNLMLGESGMQEAFGQASEAPQPGQVGPTAGMPSNVLPLAETGAPPTQIGPGSPEELAIQQAMAAQQGPPSVGG